jgi:hypothetical protein
MKSTPITALLLSAAMIPSAYAGSQAIVSTRAEFLSAVAPDSPFSTVLVVGPVSDLNNVQLKDGLVLEGSAGSVLEASPNATTLLTVGKNTRIENLTLTLHNTQQARAIQNNAGNSVKNLTIDGVHTNGIIHIDLTDGSTDSTVTLTNNEIHLAAYPATDNAPLGGIVLKAENNSRLIMNEIAQNTITGLATDNFGIYSYAGTHGTITYAGDLHNNTLSTHGTFTAGLYNEANGGKITVTGNVTHNNITLNEAKFGAAIYNHSNHNGDIEISGAYLANELNAHDSNAKGFAFYAENQGQIHASGPIQHNTAVMTDYQSNAFFTQASETSTIDLAGNTLSQNTFHVGTAPVISNNALDNSLINFGLGSAEIVKTTLINANTLMMANTSPNTAKVVNNLADGGIIR